MQLPMLIAAVVLAVVPSLTCAHVIVPVAGAATLEARTADTRTPAPPAHYNELFQRGVCKREEDPVATSYLDYFVGNAKMEFAVEGGALAYGTCVILNHNVGANQPCYAYSLVVSSCIAGIISITTRMNGNEGVATSNKRRGTDGSSLLLDAMAGHLLDQGFDFGDATITVTTTNSSYVQRRDDHNNGTAVTGAFVIQDVVHPNLTIAPADMYFTAFSDGTGTLQMKHKLAENPDVVKRHGARLARRHDGAGFKYTFRVDYMANEARGSNIQGIANLVGSAIGNQWGWAAENVALDQWIGAVGIDYILLKLVGVGIRIIPELSGFGEEYEDIGICGDMGTPIHDELK